MLVLLKIVSSAKVKAFYEIAYKVKIIMKPSPSQQSYQVMSEARYGIKRNVTSTA